MSSELKIEDLEHSLMQRADDLADEYLQRAKRSHDHFIEDENERLQLREEREIMAAKMAADRIYRSRVQSSELLAQKKLDQLRWQLIKNVIQEVKNELFDIVKHQKKYIQLLTGFVKQSAILIESQELVVELNQSDAKNIRIDWQKIMDQYSLNKSINLSKQYHQLSGGVIVYDKNRSIRVDNTFEGRMERLSESIHQRVAEQYFSELSHEGDKIHGR